MQKDVFQVEFKARVEKWKKMDRSTDTKRKEASNFYDQKVFPTIIESFINRHSPEKEYDGLILTLGFSPNPLILSIAGINPERIAFLYTSETERFIKRIQDQTRYDSTQTDLLNIEGLDVSGIYNVTWKFARDTWGEFNNIIVDITGGKAFMGAGAALAAAVIPADICYVDSDNYSPEFRMPEPGSEFMKILEGPDTLLRIAR